MFFNEILLFRKKLSSNCCGMFIDAMPRYQHKNMCIDLFLCPKKKALRFARFDIYFLFESYNRRGESKSCMFSLKTLKNSS